MKSISRSKKYNPINLSQKNGNSHGFYLLILFIRLICHPSHLKMTLGALQMIKANEAIKNKYNYNYTFN